MVIRAQDRLERGSVIRRGNDGPINAVNGVMCELDQQQQLREGVVLQDQALSQPAFGDAIASVNLVEEPPADVIAEILTNANIRAVNVVKFG